MKIDLSEFLSGPQADLKEFLPPEPPKISLSPPEAVILHWTRTTCKCGREFESQTSAPMIRYTIFRRIGFGTRPNGKVYIPIPPNYDVSDLPIETQTSEEKIFHCPYCIGQKSSLDLFPSSPIHFVVKRNGAAMPPHAAAWLNAHSCADPKGVEEALQHMKKNAIDFDDLLAFRTTKSDLAQTFLDLSTVDPEE